MIRFLLASLASLERQGLRPDAVLIEDAANGPAVCQLLRRQVPGLIAIPPKGSKASRAHAVAPLVEAGQVRFHHRSESLIEEMLAFSPRGGGWPMHATAQPWHAEGRPLSHQEVRSANPTGVLRHQLSRPLNFEQGPGLFKDRPISLNQDCADQDA